MDTDASGFREWQLATAIAKYYLKREKYFDIVPLQVIIDNWKTHELWPSRVLEKRLIELWDQHPHAQKIAYHKGIQYKRLLATERRYQNSDLKSHELAPLP